MIPRDVMASIRQFDADLAPLHAAGKSSTVQWHRHLLLGEVDQLTKERDRLAAELAATKIVSVRVGV